MSDCDRARRRAGILDVRLGRWTVRHRQTANDHIVPRGLQSRIVTHHHIILGTDGQIIAKAHDVIGIYIAGSFAQCQHSSPGGIVSVQTKSGSQHKIIVRGGDAAIGDVPIAAFRHIDGDISGA